MKSHRFRSPLPTVHPNTHECCGGGYNTPCDSQLLTDGGSTCIGVNVGGFKPSGTLICPMATLSNTYYAHHAENTLSASGDTNPTLNGKLCGLGLGLG